MARFIPVKEHPDVGSIKPVKIDPVLSGGMKSVSDETRHVTETKPVTVEEVVEVAKEKVTNYVTQSNETHNVTATSKHCSTCTCVPPKTGAERQREWRERKKGK